MLSFRDYRSALRALRRLRRRGAKLVAAVVVVEVEHWNKVKDLLERGGERERELVLYLKVL